MPGALLTTSHVITSFVTSGLSSRHPHHLRFMDGENEAERIEVHAQGHDGSLSLDALNLSWLL